MRIYFLYREPSINTDIKKKSHKVSKGRDFEDNQSPKNDVPGGKHAQYPNGYSAHIRVIEEEIQEMNGFSVHHGIQQAETGKR